MNDFIAKYDKLIIAATAIAVVLSGIIRAFTYKFGDYMLSIVIIAYLLYRFCYYLLALIKRKPLSSADKQHLLVFLGLIAIAILSKLNIQSAPFLSLFLLLIDYFICINPKSKPS